MPCAPACLALLWLLPTAAGAESRAEAAAPSTEFGAPPQRAWELRVDADPGWAIGVDGSAGVAVLVTADGTGAHGILESRLRARLGYVQLGGLIEHSDYTEQEWRSVGGFVGAFLPYRTWMDWEFSAGAVSRRFHSSDTRYGPAGYEYSNAALLFRAGFSDRSSERVFGVRLGAHLTLTSDLSPRDESWRFNLGSEASPDYVEGRSRVGGHTISIAVDAGFDFAAPRLRPSP